MPEMGPAPVPITRGHSASTRRAVTRIVYNPAPWFFSGLRCHGLFWIRRIDRLGTPICQIHHTRWGSNFRVLQLTPSLLGPNTRPITPSQLKIGSIGGNGLVSFVTRIVLVKLVKFLTPRRTKHDVSGLGVRSQKIEPSLPKIIVSSHLKGRGISRIVIVGINPGSDANLSLAIHTTRLLAFFLCLG